ncbi:hypothetical protein SK3146_02281 [Paenibacillus konkukensis]|uniref:Uncharacterized protein n=1 Tax=Paenibacillus konkukensis TaxID=2020716 RepID=A0ABY4RM70_9BACL|nr:hypothetical protein SK3146_02281 [Paenibacillus konkukensis]
MKSCCGRRGRSPGSPRARLCDGVCGKDTPNGVQIIALGQAIMRVARQRIMERGFTL